MRKEKIKVALVANTSWSVYNFRLEVCRYLQEKGAEIYVIAPRDKHSEKLVAEGFHFIHAPLKAYSHNPSDDVRYFRFLLKTYRQYRFDHIFHYTIKANTYGSICARALDLRSAAVVTGLGRFLSQKDGLTKWVTERLYRLGCKCADTVWFLNEKDKHLFIQNRYVQKSKTFLLGSEGVDLNRFTRKTNKKSQTSRFLFAGRLIIEKGILHFLEAAARVKRYFPKSEFEIVGFLDPADAQCINPAVIQKYQKNRTITFHGDTEDIRPFLERADCVVFPSYYGEGVSRILLEAAAMSIPIITSDNRGCTEVVIDGYNGFLCKKKSIESLVDQILAFISLDQGARRVMGENGRSLVEEKYDVERICSIYSELVFPEELRYDHITQEQPVNKI